MGKPTVTMWHPKASEPIEVPVGNVENARANGWSEEKPKTKKPEPKNGE